MINDKKLNPIVKTLKTFSSEFQEIKLWFTDQNNKPLEVEDKINLTLLIR